MNPIHSVESTHCAGVKPERYTLIHYMVMVMKMNMNMETDSQTHIHTFIYVYENNHMLIKLNIKSKGNQHKISLTTEEDSLVLSCH